MIQDISLSKTNSTFVLEYKGNYFVVDKLVYLFVDALHKHKTIENAIKRKHEIYTLIDSSNAQGFSEIIVSKLKTILSKTGTDKYIFHKTTLIPENIIKKTAKYFTAFFNRVIFSILFIIFSTVTFLYFFYSEPVQTYTKSNNQFSLYIVLLLFTLLLHECGHAISSKILTNKNGAIGFGFYNRFLPVFYADVTHAWEVDKISRIIITLSGIYFQLFINCIIIISTFYFPGLQFLNHFLIVNASIILYSFIPFFRNDGYWLLVDILNINNLHNISTGYLLKVYFNDLKFNIAIFLYSIGKLLFNIYFYYLIFNAVKYILTNHYFNNFTIAYLLDYGLFLQHLFVLIIAIFMLQSKYIEFTNLYYELKNGRNCRQ